MKKLFAVAGIAVGTILIAVGIITLASDESEQRVVLPTDDDDLGQLMVEEGENVVRLPNADNK